MPHVLPTNVVAHHYDLRVTPNMDDWTFAGEVAIDLSIKEPTKAIVCNAVALKIASAALRVGDENSTTHAASDIAYDEADGRVTFTFADEVPAGSAAVLRASYTGQIGDNLCGYYRAKYGEGKYLGTTQFEAVDARRALPCWDEPALKSTFQLTLVVPEGHVALSNTDEVRREAVDGGAKVAVTFDKTPKMSTYLLAWTHGTELRSIETTVKKVHGGGETRIRIFANGDAAQKRGEFALEVASKCLPLYEDFFGSDYVLSKADLLAIPDFAAGAMENWGHITYRETALLCDANSSASDKAYVAIVVAHELAHQWFGNLVTMQWWRELWLNEAFATWVEYWAVDTLYPEFEVWTGFVGRDAVRAFDLDAMLSSHAIEVEINRAEEVDAIFDAISYCKGCCVLRMIADFIGVDAFRRGVSAYLKEFELSNATTVDLWRHLGAAAGGAGADLDQILANWTGAQGYPWVHASRSGETGVKLEQHRFLASGTAPAELDTVWQVPLNIAYELADKPGEIVKTRHVLKERSDVLTLPSAAKWVRVNSEGSTFCRVLHADELNVTAAIPAMSVLDRMSLASDVRALALAGHLPAPAAYAWLSVFSNESDPSVLKTVISIESTLRQLLPQGSSELAAEHKAKFNVTAVNAYTAFREKHGLTPAEGDTPVTAEVRASVLRRLVKAGDLEAIAVSLKYWNEREQTPIPADLRGAVYATAVEVDGEKAFDQLIAMYKAASDKAEGTRCLRALTAKDDGALLRKAREFGTSDEVATQDKVFALAGLAHHTAGGLLFVNMVLETWPYLWQTLPPMLLGRLIQCAEGLEDAELVDRFEAFFPTLEDNQLNSVERNYKQGVEAARNTIAWIAAQRPAFVAAL